LLSHDGETDGYASSIRKRLLAAYNQWNEAGYDAMLSKGRARQAAEKGEFASYHALHGACNGYEVIEVQSERAARFAMQCKRGELEMHVTLGSEGLIKGFSGISRGVPTPERAARVARDVLALITSWKDAVHERSWQSPDSATAKRVFAGLRRRHGRCTLGSYVRRFEIDEFTVKCDHGGDLTLSFGLSGGQPAKITRHKIRPARESNCPRLD